MKRKRMKILFTILISALLFITTVMPTGISATADDNSKSQGLISAFTELNNSSKPMTRYWVPAAQMDEDSIREDIATFDEMGFGGVEVVSMVYTNSPTAEYSWGSENWNKVMDIILDECAQRDMTADFTIGPSWPIASPYVTDADHEGSLYELAYGLDTIKGDEVYDGTIPERNSEIIRSEGTSKLLAVSAYKQTADKTIDYDSYIDLTDVVTLNESDQPSSTVYFDPQGTADEEWVIFSFFEQPAAETIGGLYVVDHFGKAGAQACIDYWEEQTLQLLESDIGSIQSIFCDSLEYDVALEWTRGFGEYFKELNGYDVTAYLPILGRTSDGYKYTTTSQYVFTDEDLTQKVGNDFYNTITNLFIKNHLEPLQEWAESHGFDMRYQTAYGKMMEVTESSLAVGRPEAESLGGASLDRTRRMSGTVHMGEKETYSAELNAEFYNNYGQTYEDMMWWVKRSWASGMNLQVWHGSAYSGLFQDQIVSSWPGFDGFPGAYISNVWNRSLTLEHASYYTDFMARYNYILQKTAKVDVAIFKHVYDDDVTEFGSYGDGEAVYPDNGTLNANGYSYDFLSTSLLYLDNAVVTNNRLAESGPAYKALIVHNQESMDLSTVNRLIELAKGGLPIVMVGDTPTKLMHYSEQVNGATDEDVIQAVKKLIALDNVVTVEEYDDVSDTLKDMGITPYTNYDSPSEVVSYHTSDEMGEFYYLYNYNKVLSEDVGSGLPTTYTDENGDIAYELGSTYPWIDKETYLKPQSLSLTLDGEGKPYLMDGWTGEITPISEYTVVDGKIHLDLDFVADECMMIAILTDEQAKANGLTPLGVSVIETDKDTVSYSYANNELVAKAIENGPFTTKLSDGKEIITSVSDIQEPITIDSWALDITSVYSAQEYADHVVEDDKTSYEWPVKEYNGIQLTDGLKPWHEISDDLKYASGYGVYTGTFDLEQTPGDYGAYINLGEVTDTFQITVNGQLIPVTDQLDTSQIDIGDYVIQGTNTIEVKVGTTLYNAVKHSIGKIGIYYEAYGGWIMYTDTIQHSYGLMGTDGVVTVTPYKNTVIYETNSSPGESSQQSDESSQLSGESSIQSDVNNINNNNTNNIQGNINDSPRTGDTSMLMMVILSIASLGFIYFVLRRHKN